ncbi:peroxiredoxin Q/BCP [Tahibacter aquaticus]|jgi:peroxiredoxin Q/BCP|uniref:thioredoxin-dependent peroxiredoxin n=1 Tax=Tahibacter aquaticus TaxID=520092 RepID=A0A4R6YX47_9GAMM|nr:peroxiredoxin [Tahibacter aquaticus]TDR43287.1 peroxiredoxin Q/BCP [Tahibacter aquaticus]
MLDTGSKVPALSGTSTDGTSLALSTLKGKWVVVYFYPKDSTPACTTEAQDFRDLHAQFAARNAVVIGVSRDSTRSHANFTAKQQLPFALIADTDEAWCKAFDVIHEKVLYGRRYLGIVRSTFLIGPDGRISRRWSPVKVAGHAAEVLASIPDA